jgi:hypothetical protein
MFQDLKKVSKASLPKQRLLPKLEVLWVLQHLFN